MNRKTGWIPAALAVAFISLLVVVSTIHSSQNRFNISQSYRLTADVEANGRHYVVSQIYDYNCSRRVPASGASIVVGAPCELYGKAMRVNLGFRGSLFILMNGWNPDHTGFSGADVWVHGLMFEAQHHSTIPTTLIPVMVRFSDPADPTTLRLVDPAHLDRSFGPGVSLKSISVDFGAAKPPADDLNTVLPWLSGLHGDRLPQALGAPANKLHGFDFEWPPQ